MFSVCSSTERAIMELKSEKKGEVYIVHIDGPIKSGMEFDLADELEARMHEMQVPKMVIDMKKVPFINSAALGILLNVFQEIEKRNGRLGLASISTEVDNLLEITKLGTVFEIFRNVEDALDSIVD